MFNLYYLNRKMYFTSFTKKINNKIGPITVFKIKRFE